MGSAGGARWPSWGGPRPAWGVEVTDGCLRAATCDASGRPGQVLVIERATDDAGESAFRTLRARSAGRRWIASLPPAWIDALPIHLPPTGVLEDLLVERARAQLSFAVEDAVLDYLEPETRPDGSRRVLLYAVPRARVAALVAAAARAGCDLVTIESAGAALQRALSQRAVLDARRTLIVHLDEEHVLFLVANSERVVAERALGWGTTRIATAIATQLEIPVATAQQVLRGTPTLVEDDPEAASEVARVVTEIAALHLAELGRETERMQAYCRGEFRDGGIERLLLSGFAAELGCVRAGLADVGPGAEILNPDVGGTYAVAFGLALRRLERTCVGST